MTEDEAAERAAQEIYKMKPHQRTSGLNLIYDQDKGKLPLRDWLKRFWKDFPRHAPRS